MAKKQPASPKRNAKLQRNSKSPHRTIENSKIINNIGDEIGRSHLNAMSSLVDTVIEMMKAFGKLGYDPSTFSAGDTFSTQLKLKMQFTKTQNDVMRDISESIKSQFKKLKTSLKGYSSPQIDELNRIISDGSGFIICDDDVELSDKKMHQLSSKETQTEGNPQCDQAVQVELTSLKIESEDEDSDDSDQNLSKQTDKDSITPNKEKTFNEIIIPNDKIKEEENKS